MTNMSWANFIWECIKILLPGIIAFVVVVNTVIYIMGKDKTK